MSSASGQAIYRRRVAHGTCVRNKAHGPARPDRRTCWLCGDTETVRDRLRYAVAESTTARGIVRVSYCAAILTPAAPAMFSRCAPLKHDRGACAPRRKAKS